jgi:hypothetical protein
MHTTIQIRYPDIQEDLSEKIYGLDILYSNLISEQNIHIRYPKSSIRTDVHRLQIQIRTYIFRTILHPLFYPIQWRRFPFPVHLPYPILG